jgi:hypothetical protein
LLFATGICYGDEAAHEKHDVEPAAPVAVEGVRPGQPPQARESADRARDTGRIRTASGGSGSNGARTVGQLNIDVSLADVVGTPRRDTPEPIRAVDGGTVAPGR